jgi:cellulose synthase/poly-beta-1,6-N-acetylglucosamine synthase-like glycosyltransferase
MLVFLFVICTIFICLNVIAYIGLSKVEYESKTAVIFPNPEVQQTFVSVIVAARNEAHNLPALLNALVTQTHYPLEIIVVSDRSTDETPAVVKFFQDARIRFVEIKEVPKGVSPKKHALATGIRIARGEILFLTDADCRPAPTWIAETLKCFDKRTAVVIGYSPFRKKENESFIERFQRYECFRTAMLSAGAVGRNAPYMATGRNLAYRKEVFETIGGFDAIKHILSGDDDLLLQRIARKTRMKIKYFVSPTAEVETDPQPTLEKFLNQKARHYSAAFHYPPASIFFLMTYHLVNFLMVFFLPFQLFIGGFSLSQAMSLFGEEEFRWKSVYLEPIYAVYAFFSPLLAFKKFEWKA